MGTHPSTSTALRFVAFFEAFLGGRSSFKASVISCFLFFLIGSFRAGSVLLFWEVPSTIGFFFEAVV
jgi:hypothetical protein